MLQTTTRAARASALHWLKIPKAVTRTCAFAKTDPRAKPLTLVPPPSPRQHLERITSEMQPSI